MGLILWLIFGALAGWIATIITGGQRSLLTNILVGIAGSVLGGFIFSALGISTTGLLGSLIVSIIGAAILLFVLRLFSSGEQSPRLTAQTRKPILSQQDTTARPAFGRELGYIEIIAIILTVLVSILTLIRAI